MNARNLDNIKAQLEEQNTKTTAKADTLRVEIVELDEELARINAALIALSGTLTPLTNGKASKKNKKKTLAPASTKAQVVSLMTEELSRHNTIQEDDLKGRIDKTLVDSGHSLMGFSLRFKEALADPQFSLTHEGVSLNAKAHGLSADTSSGTSVAKGQSTSTDTSRSSVVQTIPRSHT